MSSRTESLSRGDISLRKLRSIKNHFALASTKWITLGNRIFSISDNSEKDENLSTPKNRFANDIGSILKSEQRANPDRIITTFVSEMGLYRRDLIALTERLMPQALREKLWPLSEDEVPNDPIELLTRVLSVQSEDSVIDRGTFEAMRALEFTGDYFFLTTQVNGWRHAAPKADGKTRVTDFVKWLSAEGVIEEKKLAIYLDPKDEWRCAGVEFDEQDKRRRKNHLKRLLRTVEVLKMKALFGDHVQAIVQARAKDYMSAFARRFRDPQAHLFESVPDMYGLRFTYLDKKMMKRGVAYLAARAAIIQSDGSVKNVQIANRHSHRKLCIQSQYLYLDGRRREVQHMPAKNLYNIEYSLGPENHSLYHLRWYTDCQYPGLFFHLFPPEIYGINWSDPVIRQEMEAHVKEETLRKIERDQT